MIVRNKIKKTFFLFTCLVAYTNLLYAQNLPPEPYNRPEFITYLDVGLGTTGIDLGISARTRNHLATGIYLKALYHAPAALNNFNSAGLIVAIKAKYYKNKSTNGFFGGPMAGAHGFATAFKPIFGITAGFDRYSLLNILGSYTTRFGIELQAGLDTIGQGYAGININIGFGFLNTGEIHSPYQ